jgi:hypothetical protein
MSKKKHSTATQEIEAAQKVHWRLLLRNLTFQEDMAFLKVAWQMTSFQDRHFRPSPAEKENWSQIMVNLWSACSNFWNLRRINLKPIEMWPDTTHLSLDDILKLEPHAALFIAPQEHVLLSNDSDAKYLARPNPSHPQRFIFVRVDLSQPIENLLPLVEKEIRLRAQKYTKRSKSQLKKIDLQLQVYDRAALQGEIFSKIARELRKPVATIKSAYLLAKNKIDALAIKPIFHSEKQPGKKARAIASFDANFDPETHYTSCSTCKKAKTADEMCRLVQYFVNQETSHSSLLNLSMKLSRELNSSNNFAPPVF